MTLKIAMQSDELTAHDGSHQSYSARWIELASQWDIEPVAVDVYAADVLTTIAGCDAFMWRYDPSAQRRLYANRLLYAIEFGLRKPVFPSLATRWQFEDKIGQYYFMAAAGIPTPATHVAWTREEAVRFCRAATYPFVLKLATGYQSSNVRLVSNCDEALYYVDEMFGHGVASLGYRPASRTRLMLRRLRAASDVLRGRNPYGPTPDADLQYGYFLAQEFVPDNSFDVRVTIIGDRAFITRRFNRPGDFRASGTLHVDLDATAVNEDTVRLGYRVSRASGGQTISLDILRRHDEPIVTELGMAYPQVATRNCPGHWVLHGDPGPGTLEWQAGHMDPADAILADFIAAIHQSRNARPA